MNPYGSNFLPSVKSVEWNFLWKDGILSVLPFLSPKLDSLEIALDEAFTSHAAKTLLQCLTGRVPELTTFKLGASLPVASLENELVDCILAAAKLKYLALPHYYQTKKVVSALATLPLLSTLSVSYRKNMPYDDSGMQFPAFESGFDDLRTLRMDASLADAARIFETPCRLPDLEDVMVISRRYTNPIHLHSLLFNLSTGCNQLETFELSLLSDKTTPSPPLAFASLHPLLSCQSLTGVLIGHDYPVRLQEADIVLIGKSWPHLQNFQLCEEPYLENVDEEHSGTPFALLPTMAKHLPNLDTLGLFFDTDSPFEFGGDLNPIVQWADLERLRTGFSDLKKEKVQLAAFVIASLTPPGLIVESGESTWYHRDTPADDGRIMKWDQVQEDLKLLWKVKGVVQEQAGLCKARHGKACRTKPSLLG